MVKKPSEEEEKFYTEAEIERRKKAQLDGQLGALAQKDAQDVASLLGISDLDLAAELVELGFAGETAGVFPLLPLVYVAWADGEVTSAERRKILDAAVDRGALSGTPGYDFLEQLLTQKPKASFFDTCLSIIRRIFESTDHGDDAKKDLVSLSLAVANASGGFLGLFGEKVSDNEKSVIQDIIEELGMANSDAANKLLDQLKG